MRYRDELGGDDLSDPIVVKIDKRGTLPRDNWYASHDDRVGHLVDYDPVTDEDEGNLWALYDDGRPEEECWFPVHTCEDGQTPLEILDEAFDRR